MTSLSLSAVNQNWIRSEWVTNISWWTWKQQWHIRIRAMRRVKVWIRFKLSKQLKRTK